MKVLSLFTATLLCLSFATNSLAADRPNILIILCDDLGYGDLAIHGHPHIQTPNLDRLANEGIRFTNFYSTAPVCSPSRVGLLTGRSPNRAGVYDWIPEAKTPRPDAREQVHMKKDEVTIAHLLKDAGYATVMAGKWHCNAAFNDPSQPQPGDAGFDHWLATQNNAAPGHQNPKNYVRNGEAVGEIEGFSCQIAADEIITWVGSHQKENSDQPFFGYLAFHEPHEPVRSPEELINLYRDVTVSPLQAEYYANVHNVDLAVGKVVEAFEKLGIRDDTLIVFTSDNGPETLNRYRSASRSWGITAHLAGHETAYSRRWFSTSLESSIGPMASRQVRSSMLPHQHSTCFQQLVLLLALSPTVGRHFDGINIADSFKSGEVPQAFEATWSGATTTRSMTLAWR